MIYNLGHKRRKARRELLQKSLQNSHSRITGPPSSLFLFCCQRPLQQETKKEHHEAVANCCVWLQPYTTSRWTPKHKVKRYSDAIQNTAVAQVWDFMLRKCVSTVFTESQSFKWYLHKSDLLVNGLNFCLLNTKHARSRT